MRLLISVTFVITTFISGCKGNSVNSLFLTDDELSTNEKLSQSKQAYDEGDFDKAEKIAKEVYDSNINKENAAIMLSYINLSQAGFDPFALSKNIMSSTENDSEIQESTGTSDGLLSMSTILNLQEEDYDAMSTGKESLGVYDVYIPNNDLDSIRANANLAIYHINNAVRYMCPYMDTQVKLDGELNTDEDTRHITAECGQGSTITSTKGHFAWTLAHLAEALVFYSVTMYSSNGTTPNISAYANSISNQGPTEFISSISALSNYVGNVFPDANGETMSGALFNDLETVNASIDYMANQLPSSIANGLKKVTASIKQSTEKINEASSTANASTEIRDALTKSLSDTLSQTITEKQLTGSDLTSACSALEGINSDVALPSSCPSN